MTQPTRYEQRVCLLITRTMQRRLRQALNKFLRTGCFVSINRATADKLLPDLSLIAGGCDTNSLRTSKMAQIIRSSVRATLNNSLNSPWSIQDKVAVEVARDLVDRAALLDLELRMPPIRREPAKRRPAPLTPRQRRAADTADKYKAWMRRLATAKTKVAVYRKKVNYYRKKGVL